MNNRKPFLQKNQAALVLCAALLGTLTGCVGYEERPDQGSVYVVPSAGISDDYVYYPNYECYYSVSRHQYAYREGNAWVNRPAPRGVDERALRASPSVRMDFHDSPAQHHAAVAKQYPKNWKPAEGNRGQNRKEDGQGDHRDK